MSHRFLTELILDPPDATSDQSGVPLLDEDYLILSTIHSAKGQEWRSVFVLNAVDGCIPSDLATGCEADIEEERRLLYVAMTRAADRLIVCDGRDWGTKPPTGLERKPVALLLASLRGACCSAAGRFRGTTTHLDGLSGCP